MKGNQNQILRVKYAKKVDGKSETFDAIVTRILNTIHNPKIRRTQ